jgi:predicted TIM-barrel enzyme
LLCRPADWPLQTSTGIRAADFEPWSTAAPVAEPADAECVLRKTTGIHGFYGASSLERLPVERALTDQTRAFTSITF